MVDFATMSILGMFLYVLIGLLALTVIYMLFPFIAGLVTSLISFVTSVLMLPLKMLGKTNTGMSAQAKRVKNKFFK